MSTSAAAVAISSVALAEASAARTEACKATVKSYKAETATVAEMRGYAECVQRLHPADLTGGVLIIVKIAIVMVLIGAVVGAWSGWREGSYDRWINMAMSGFMGAILVFAGLVALFFVVSGVDFLFT